MKILRLLLPLGVALLVLGTIAAACSSDDEATIEEELTLEEYFLQVQTVFSTADAQSEALDLNAPDPEEFARDDEGLAALDEEVAAFFEDGAPTFRDFVKNIDDINPPDVVKSSHAELADAGRAIVKSTEDLVDQIRGPMFFDEVRDREGGVMDALAEASIRFDDACFALQAVADDNGINVNLCG